MPRRIELGPGILEEEGYMNKIQEVEDRILGCQHLDQSEHTWGKEAKEVTHRYAAEMLEV
ncbi:hypothetical protein KXW62_008573 [Aspergillus fumigatus]|nr:hypothetical protein KXW62_008573 [Aspergillus fumigatus]